MKISPIYPRYIPISDKFFRPMSPLWPTFRTLMYAHVYTCTHCGRKGHLAKFCYDRVHNVNLANRFVWVRKSANPHGSNRVWVPKTTPILFDVGVGSHSMWGYWCLEVDAFRAKRWQFWMHHFQGEFGGRTTLVWRHRDVP